MPQDDPNTGRRPPAVDVDYLDALRDDLLSDDDDDGDDPVIELIDLFIGSAGPTIEAVEAARVAGDGDELAKAAHTLISRGAWVGAMYLSDLSRTLEVSARAGVATPAMVDHVLDELARVAEALSDIRAQAVAA